MTRLTRIVALAAALSAVGVPTAFAQPARTSDVSGRHRRELSQRISAHAEDFHRSVERAIDRSAINGRPAVDQLKRAVKEFDRSVDVLRDHVNGRRSRTEDAENVLRSAAFVDSLMMRHELDARAQEDWRSLRMDMNDLARGYDIAWNWNAGSRNMPARVDDHRVEWLVGQIERRTQQFGRSLDRSFDRSRADSQGGKDDIQHAVGDLRQTLGRLKDRVKGRTSDTPDVEELLRRGTTVDDVMRRYSFSAEADRDWKSLRGDLDQLASAYRIATNWTEGTRQAARSAEGAINPLTGTFELEPARSDDARRAADLATRPMAPDQRQRTYQRLLMRLEAPEQLAIERVDRLLTIASTRGPRVTLDADGRDHMERSAAGSTMRTRVTLLGDGVVVATTGDRRSDFTAVFEPIDDGARLRMTRTLDDEGLRQPVTVRASYRRVSDEPRWDVDSHSGKEDEELVLGGIAGGRDSDGVPDGIALTFLLDETLDSANVRDGDRYTMTARSPARYEGAVLHGFVSTRTESKRVEERGMMLNLTSVTLRDGSSHPFDGVIESILTAEGEGVKIDRSGTVDAGDSRTDRTVERGAIGAALGAIIGTVVGGGKGAAIGAVLGGAGGAGTVLVGGEGRIELRRGTAFTITSGDSRRRGPSPLVLR